MRRARRALAAATVAVGVVASSATAATGQATTDTEVVMLRTDSGSVADAEALLTLVGGQLLPSLDSVGVAAARVPAGLVDGLRALGSVAHVEVDRPLALQLDSSHRATRATEVVGGALPGGGTLDGSGVGIAIIDSGVDGTHPFFQEGGRSKVVVNLDNQCLLGDNPFQGDAEDCFTPAPGNNSDQNSVGGHGTHVAGIAAGVPLLAGDEPVVGAAPGAELTALSVGIGPSVLQSALAFEWIVANHPDPCGDGTCAPIRVVNNSYGPVGGGDFDPESPTALLQRRLVAEGVTVVWAAGNDGGDGGSDVTNDAGKDPTPGVITVANYDDGGTGDRDGELAPSSSRGASDDPSTWPDLSAPGTDILSSCGVLGTACPSFPGAFTTLTGTSMAAPHVAGYVAVLKQADPALTPGEVERLLLRTARRFTSGAPYRSDDPRAPGTGSTSFDKGHGLVDLAAALAQVTTVQPPAPVLDPDVVRVAGADRVRTAAAVSAAGFEGATTVVLARADEYADALAGGPLAAAEGAPLLLTATSGLSAAARDEVRRLGATRAVLLGGTAALSDQVRADLEAEGLTVERIAGRDRFATATAIADALGGDPADAWVVEGRNADPRRGWPDAVAAGAAAARATADGAPQPIVLVTRDAVPAATVTWLRDNAVDVTIVGGTAAVSEATARDVDALAGEVERVAGPDRFATAALVAARAAAAGADEVVVATGLAFPDALGAGPLVAARGGVLLLTRPDALPSAAEEVLRGLAPLDRITVVGGPNAVRDAVLAQLSAYV